MIDVTAQRGAGDIVGETIENPLIVTQGVAIERGRREIEKATKISLIRLRTRYQSGFKIGSLIEVLDSLQGAAWRGVVTSIDVAYDGLGLFVELGVERPL